MSFIRRRTSATTFASIVGLLVLSMTAAAQGPGRRGFGVPGGPGPGGSGWEVQALASEAVSSHQRALLWSGRQHIHPNPQQWQPHQPVQLHQGLS